MHKYIHKVLQSKWTPRCFSLVVIVYAISMVLLPAIRSGGDLTYVMSVWDRWQAFNVGVMALSASVITFYYRSWRRWEERNIKAKGARALLAHSLPKVIKYCEEYGKYLASIFQLVPESPVSQADIVLPEIPDLPRLPPTIFGVFRENIEYADELPQKAMLTILECLQIHESQMEGTHQGLLGTNNQIVDTETVLAHLSEVANIFALTNRLFGYVREDSKYDDSPLRRIDVELFVRDSQFPRGQLEEIVGYVCTHLD